MKRRIVIASALACTAAVLTWHIVVYVCLRSYEQMSEADILAISTARRSMHGGAIPDVIRRWQGKRVSVRSTIIAFRNSDAFFIAPRDLTRSDGVYYVEDALFVQCKHSPPSLPAFCGITIEGTLHIDTECAVPSAGSIPLRRQHEVIPSLFQDLLPDADVPPFRLSADRVIPLWSASSGTSRYNVHLVYLCAPLVIVLLLLAAYLRFQWIAGRRADRRLAGLCPACGYDIRFSKTRCPECGTIFGRGKEDRQQRTG